MSCESFSIKLQKFVGYGTHRTLRWLDFTQDRIVKESDNRLAKSHFTNLMRQRRSWMRQRGEQTNVISDWTPTQPREFIWYLAALFQDECLGHSDFVAFFQSPSGQSSVQIINESPYQFQLTWEIVEKLKTRAKDFLVNQVAFWWQLRDLGFMFYVQIQNLLWGQALDLYLWLLLVCRIYRVSHSGLASEDLCRRALGWTLYPIEKTFPIIITSKVFFQLVCV
jgi:hypothetical protein